MCSRTPVSAIALPVSGDGNIGFVSIGRRVGRAIASVTIDGHRCLLRNVCGCVAMHG
jgi:hypothetical protein